MTTPAHCEALDAGRDTTDLCRWESHEEPAPPTDHAAAPTSERGA